jgi:nucleoside-diphosphate-sugar epimerase
VKALVTGATGFIGRTLCRSLIDAGVETVAMNRPGSGRVEGVASVTADLADETAVTRCLSDVKADLVYHLAGVTSATRVLDAVVPTFTANLTSTVSLLTAATRVGCHRIVLAGSLEEPDAVSADDVPSSPYAASKWAGSMYARMFWQLYQTPVTVARIARARAWISGPVY